MTKLDDTCSMDGTSSLMAKGSDSHIYGNGAIANGYGCNAGTHAYRIISGDSNLNTWKLTTVDGLSVGMIYSVRVTFNYDFAGTIVGID